MKKNVKQMSDSFLIGILLALVGGFLDAYTYISRDHVFANAQTGNMVLLGINFTQGNFIEALYYLVPILSFFTGIILAEVIKNRFKEHDVFHWRQIVILIEFFIITFVGFIPRHGDMAANALVSFVCSLQVESFRKFKGNPYATTMCTGNLRSATEHLYLYHKTGDSKSLYNSLQYFGIIGFFITGAVIGTFLTDLLYIKAIFFCSAMLLLIWAMMFIKN